MFVGSSRTLGARQLWKTFAPPKAKHFYWLDMYGRCWTAKRRRRHGLQDSDDCALCGQHPEMIEHHLLLGCVFSRQLWLAVLRRPNLELVVAVRQVNIFAWWLRERKAIPKTTARPGFDSLFFLLGWSIWKELNARTFGGPSTLPLQLLSQVIDEAKDWMMVGYRKLNVLLSLLLALCRKIQRRPCLTGTENDNLAQPSEPNQLSHRSKEKLACTDFKALRQTNQTHIPVIYPHSARLHGNEKTNQAAPKSTFCREAEKIHRCKAWDRQG